MVLLEQILALLDFMESRPDLAHSHYSRSLEGRTLAKRLWAECAQILNAVAADCPNKSPAEWRAFYNEFKSKLMKKVKLHKGEGSDTGGALSKKIMLTPLQKRLYNILHPPPGRSKLNQLPRRRRSPTQQAKEIDHAAFEAPQARLEQIEAGNAEALTQAQATEHLAAAIDRLGTATNQAADRLAAAIEKVGEMISLFVEPL